jgi:glycosyltransferase involved in cell wall biosynthesis/SAM-dependent methyltransferase
MYRKPLISVVTIFLDCAPFLAAAIESVLAQTLTDWELLLVDDGSADGSSEIARAYERRNPHRIRYLQHPDGGNHGMSASRNLGIAHARGRYLCFLDGDDEWLPAKLDRQSMLLEGDPSLGLVYGPTLYWHGWTGSPADAAKDHVPALGHGARTRFEPPELLERNYPLGEAAAPCLCSLMVRTDAVRQVGGFEPAFRGFYEDQVFLCKMYLTQSIAILHEVHDRYRIHERSCSAITRRQGEYQLHRRRFLGWLDEYLARRGNASQSIVSMIRQELDALSANGHQCLTLGPMRLRLGNNAVARLVFAAAPPHHTRVEIESSGLGLGHDVQVNLGGLALSAGQRYAISMLARADAPRSVAVGCADALSPWENLGFYEHLPVSADWQHFSRTFEPCRSQPAARIHFDLGESNIAVELSGISLHDLNTGATLLQPTALGTLGSIAVAPLPLPTVGRVASGDLRRLEPVSRNWGLDRGLPVDRYYIEQFLGRQTTDIFGNVLEIEDDSYSRRFARDRVLSVDVLHVTNNNPRATIVADLTRADHIPAEHFDCIILTQTLHLIFDTRAALATLHRILKPGGVLLATFPGLSRTSLTEWPDSWYWGFTRASATRLFSDAFSGGRIDVDVYGNVLTTIAFLHGLAAEDLAPHELEHHDPEFELLLAVRAVKAQG